MPLTDDLSKLARSANGIFNSIAANATTVTSISVGTGVSITSFSSDGTLIGNSNVTVPTEQAVKTYADNTANTAANIAANIAAGNAYSNAATLINSAQMVSYINLQM